MWQAGDGADRRVSRLYADAARHVIMEVFEVFMIGVWRARGGIVARGCALTAAGHDRLSAAGQWVERASQGELARLGCPYDPLTGRYRCPDEKTIRTVLDRLTPKAPSRALPEKAERLPDALTAAAGRA